MRLIASVGGGWAWLLPPGWKGTVQHGEGKSKVIRGEGVSGHCCPN